MKKYSIKHFIKMAIALIGVVSLLSSCLKDPVENPNTALLVVNTGIPLIDVYIDNQKINADPLAFQDRFGYFAMQPAVRKVDVTTGGTTSVLASGTLPFSQGKYYSFFMARHSTSPDSIEAIITEDDLSDPPNNKAKIRFANLVPDAPNVDLAVTSGPTLFSNKAFKSISDFTTVDVSSAYRLVIRQAGSPTVKFEVPGFALESGKIYTVYIHGLWNGTAGYDALGAQIVTHQ